VCASGAVVVAWSLLIRRLQRARRQAETPPIVLCRFPGPPLCVGLTAADAAQRGLDVTFVNDAIGHTRPDHRATILDWLIEDYELKMLTSEQVMARVRGCSFE